MTSLLEGENLNEGPVFTLTRSLPKTITALSAGCSNESCVVDISDLLSDEKSPISSSFSSEVDMTQPIPPKLDPKPAVIHDTDLTSVFVPHMVFSCMAMWCCGCVLGCLGFLFAVVSARYEENGKKDLAKYLSYVSFSMSLMGFLTGTIAIILLILASFGYI